MFYEKDKITATKNTVVESDGDTAEFSVDGVEVLRVNGLKHGAEARGNIGLYVDNGTDGYFKNLSIRYDD